MAMVVVISTDSLNIRNLFLLSGPLQIIIQNYPVLSGLWFLIQVCGLKSCLYIRQSISALLGPPTPKMWCRAYIQGQK